MGKITSFLRKNQKAIFLLIFLCVTLFRVWLATGIPKLYFYGPHDDLFFAKAAQSMLQGEWMGQYNQMTLIKGPFYSFFLITSFLTGLPLFLNETIFFIGACLVLFFSLKPLLPNLWWRFIIYFAVLFIPTSFVIWINLRVYREFVNYALTLYVAGFTIGLILRTDKTPKEMLFWSIGLGFSMGAFLITREDAAWIYPIIGIILIISLYRIWRGKFKKPILKSIFLLVPVPIWFIPMLLVSYLNYTHYGFWGVSEQLERQFNRVLNSLARIETGEKWHPAIQISASARMLAYQVSPTLNQLRDPIERGIEEWNMADDQAMSGKPAWYLSRYGNGGEEIGNGHFLWLFRDAVYQKGYYDGTYPKELYRQIANEIESACDKEIIICKNENHLPAMIGVLNHRHIPIILRMFGENLFRTIKLEIFYLYSLDIDNDWSPWPEGNKEYSVFDQFAYNPVDVVSTIERDDLPSNVYGSRDLRFRAIMIKEDIMQFIFIFFRSISVPISLIAMINWFVLIYLTITKKYQSDVKFALISTFLLGGFFSRLLALTIIEGTTSIPGMHYSQSIHIFWIVFSTLMITWGIQYMQIDFSKKQKNRRKRNI